MLNLVQLFISIFLALSLIINADAAPGGGKKPTDSTDTTTTKKGGGKDGGGGGGKKSTKNQPPTAQVSTITVFQDVAYGGFIHATDPENDPMTFNLVANPAKGTVTYFDSTTGYFIYTPNPGAVGLDGFGFYVSDGTNDTQIIEEPIDIIDKHTACTMYEDGLLLDTDNDGFADLIESRYYSDPNVRASVPDASQQVSFNVDTDLDNIADYIEVWLGSDPDNADSKPLDSDLDGIPDCFDPISDGYKARLLSIGFTEPAIDVSDGLTNFGLNYSFIDNAAGVSKIIATLKGPAPAYDHTISIYTYSDGSQASTYEYYPDNKEDKITTAIAEKVLDPYMPAGIWTVSHLMIFDHAGNRKDYYETDFSGVNLDIQVSSLNDITPPELTMLSVPTHDLSDGPVSFIANYSAKDDKSGLKHITVIADGPSGQSIVSHHWLVSSNIQLAPDDPARVLTSTSQAKSYGFVSEWIEAGVWTVRSVNLQDNAGNSASISRADLESMAIQTQFTIINSKGDAIDPELLGTQMLTPVVDPTGGNTEILINISARDNLSGIKLMQLYYEGPSGQYIGTYKYITPILDGTETVGMIAPENLENGEWKISFISLTDAAGNHILIWGNVDDPLGIFTVQRN